MLHRVSRAAQVTICLPLAPDTYKALLRFSDKHSRDSLWAVSRFGAG